MENNNYFVPVHFSIDGIKYIGSAAEYYRHIFRNRLMNIILKNAPKNPKKIMVYLITVPKIPEKNRYPVEKKSTDYLNLYIYVVKSDYMPKLENYLVYSTEPEHYLTMSNLSQRLSLHHQISKLRENIIASNLAGILDYDIGKDSILEDNKIVDPMMTDQNITVDDYIRKILEQ